MIKPEDVKNVINNAAKMLSFNKDLLCIYNGSLSEYIERDLKAQMSPQTYEQAKFRLSPINILPKIIDKLTNIYQTPVIREAQDGTEKDSAILDFYEDKLDINCSMDSANEMFNLTNMGASLIQPYVYKGVPKLRIVAPDAYVPYSDDPIEPNVPTDIITLHCDSKDKKYCWVYSAEQMYACDLDGNILGDLMISKGMQDTVNPIGALPFVYINSSRYSLSPQPDCDGMKIIKLLPLMLSDLNYAAMFQCFSIIYGINVDEENLRMAPNAFWRFKTDATSEAKPEIGVLKPQVDYTQVLSLIESELSMWLGTKGIRASAVGSRINAENFASGISKIIDEMDTYEAREKQVKIFQKAEIDLWDLVLHKFNPYWIETQQITDIGLFTPTASVTTKFTTQLPLQTRGQIVADLQLEVASGFTSQKRAIQTLNPDLTDGEVDNLIQEIDDERSQGYGVATTKPTDTGGIGTTGTDTISGPSY